MKIAVVGGGAAGMMAAIQASGEDVVLLEKNEKLGKKLYITGMSSSCLKIFRATRVLCTAHLIRFLRRSCARWWRGWEHRLRRSAAAECFR